VLEGYLLQTRQTCKVPAKVTPHSLRLAVVDTMVKNLYWRNTKESVSQEYVVPDTIETVLLLDLHPVEFLLYTDAQLHKSESLCLCILLTTHFRPNASSL
jgi:hypothetical protein